GAGGEHLLRLVLRRLHVGLVERVDAEDRTRDRDRELPAEELLSELVLGRQPHLLRLPVRPVRRLVRRGHESLPVLAGRLCDQLLGPETEARAALTDAYLVAPVAPVLAEREPELEPRVALREAAALRHLLRALEQTRHVHPHERRRHHPERRESRVA